MKTRDRSRSTRDAGTALPGIVFTAVFVAAFTGIFVVGLRSEPPRGIVTDASYHVPTVAKTDPHPKVWPLPVSPADQRKDALARLELEAFDWRREGFGMVSLISFSIRNRGVQDARNIEIACTYFTGDGAALAVRKQQIYERVAVNHAVALPEINMGLIPDRAQTMSCLVSDAQLG